MPDVGGALTRKIGPLPAWGWGVAVGGAALGVKLMRGGGGSNTQRQVIEVPTGAPYPTPDFASDLGTALDALRDTVEDIGTRLDDLEEMPGPGNNPPSGQQPGTPWAPNWGKPGYSSWTPPVGVDVGAWLQSFRKSFPGVYDSYIRRIGAVQKPGETAEQRRARLAAEVEYYREFLAGRKPWEARTQIPAPSQAAP